MKSRVRISKKFNQLKSSISCKKFVWMVDDELWNKMGYIKKEWCYDRLELYFRNIFMINFLYDGTVYYRGHIYVNMDELVEKIKNESFVKSSNELLGSMLEDNHKYKGIRNKNSISCEFLSAIDDDLWDMMEFENSRIRTVDCTFYFKNTPFLFFDERDNYILFKNHKYNKKEIDVLINLLKKTVIKKCKYEDAELYIVNI